VVGGHGKIKSGVTTKLVTCKLKNKRFAMKYYITFLICTLVLGSPLALSAQTKSPAEPFARRAFAEFRNNSYKKAIKLADKGIKLDPYHEKSHMFRFLASYKATDYNKSAQSLTVLIGLNPERLNYYRFLAQMYQKMDRKEDACRILSAGKAMATGMTLDALTTQNMQNKPRNEVANFDRLLSEYCNE
jgi:tetratricopeptide (TPR) repeat protein